MNQGVREVDGHVTLRKTQISHVFVISLWMRREPELKTVIPGIAVFCFKAGRKLIPASEIQVKVSPP